MYFTAREQARCGGDVAVFWLSDEASTIPGVLTLGFAPSRFPFQVPRKLLGALEQWRPDILHLHSAYFPPHVTLGRWARRAGLPYVVTPHGAISPGEIRQRWMLKLPYKYLFERPNLNGATFVHMLDETEDPRAYGVRSRLELVPGGVDPTARTKPACRATHDSRRVFLFLGRLDAVQKGLDVLVRGFADADLDDATLILAGPDYRGGRRRLERLIDRFARPGSIVLRDEVLGEARAQLLDDADVFVTTSRWEGQPLAALAAAACGLPCLVTAPADPSAFWPKPEVASASKRMRTRSRPVSGT